MVRYVSRPKVIIYRFTNVLVTKGRIKNDYIQCTSENICDFLNDFWGNPELMRLIDAIRDQSYDEKEFISSMPIVFKEYQNPQAIQDSVCIYVNWKCKNTNRPKIGNYKQPHNQLIRLVVLYAMARDRGTITIHDRYVNAIKQRHQEGIRQMILSRVTSNLVDHTRSLMAFTNQGDLSNYIDGYFNTSIYKPKENSAYEEIAAILNVEPSEILFVSENVEECRVAKKVGIQVVKTSSRTKKPGDSRDKDIIRVRDMSYIILRSYDQANINIDAKHLPIRAKMTNCLNSKRGANNSGNNSADSNHCDKNKKGSHKNQTDHKSGKTTNKNNKDKSELKSGSKIESPVKSVITYNSSTISTSPSVSNTPTPTTTTTSSSLTAKSTAATKAHRVQSTSPKAKSSDKNKSSTTTTTTATVSPSTSIQSNSSSSNSTLSAEGSTGSKETSKSSYTTSSRSITAIVIQNKIHNTLNRTNSSTGNFKTNREKSSKRKSSFRKSNNR